MAAWVCDGCTTVYSVDAPRCPHCGSTNHHEQGQEDSQMAKVTVHGGATNADQPDNEVSEVVPADTATRAEDSDTASDPASNRDYESWSYRDLQAEAKNRGLSASGSQEDLVLRLLEHDERATADGDTD